VAYSAQQNRRAERFYRTIQEKVRAMLLQSQIAKQYWAEAFATAVHLYNVTPRSKLSTTPFELFCTRKPDLRQPRTFG
jgi:hypothetical protein